MITDVDMAYMYAGVAVQNITWMEKLPPEVLTEILGEINVAIHRLSRLQKIAEHLVDNSSGSHKIN